MSRRGVIIGAASVAGAAVLAVAWWLGGETAAPTRKGPPPDVSQLPESLGHPGRGQVPLQSIDRITYYTQDGDRVTKLSAEKVVPKDDFISDLIEPRAEVRFGSDRLLVIEASEGTFYLPGNDPQRGEFRSDVVITLYEAGDGQTLDTLSEHDVAVRLFLDEPTSFDRDRGRLFTEGPVHLTGPDADFKGRGLLLFYNQGRARIERLVISEGEYLRLRRQDDTDPQADVQQTPPSDATAPAERSIQARSDGPMPPPDGPTPTEAPRALPQYYQADFLDGVTVRVGQDEAHLLGETLSAFFALDLGEQAKAAQASTRVPSPAASRTRYADVQPRGGGAPAMSTNPSAPGAVTDAPPALPVLPPRSLFTPHPDDVVVHWAGKLVVLPLGAAPEGLDHPEDAMLALTGTAINRASAVTAERDAITADEVRYFTGSRRVEAVASAAVPFVLHAPGQGTLTGARLILDPAAASGTVYGPGRLLAFDPADTDTDTDTDTEAEAETRRAQVTGLPEPPHTLLDVAFERRLDLVFDPDDGGNLEAIRRATFLGEVRATGVGERPDEPLHIDAQSLAVDLERNAQGRTVPTRLTAERDVLARQPGRSIRADAFWVDFEETPIPIPTPEPTPITPTAQQHSDGASDPNAAPADPTPGTPQSIPIPQTSRQDLRVTHARATGRVSVFADAEGTTLTGRQLDAFPDEGKLVLLGTPDEPARVVRPDATLTGPTLEFHEATETLHVPGPGTLTAPLDEADPDARLAVNWQTSLRFEGGASTAAVLGQVFASTASATDRTRLEAHRLDLTFRPKPDAPATPATPGPDAGQQPGQASDQPLSPTESLDLREALATADPDDPAAFVRFEAQSFTPQTPDEPLTRLTLEGPSLRFMNHADDDPPLEQVHVEGAGQMLLEDYRAADQPADDPTQPQPNAPRRGDQPADQPGGDKPPTLRLSGRGVSYFNWTGSLLLDARGNDLLMRRDVRMIHDPLDGEPKVRLFGDLLTADLTETGGLGAWMADDAPKARLRRVQLDGNVTVEQEHRRVQADHLRYVEQSRDVWLWGDDGRQVRVTDEANRRNNLEARFIRWDLDRNRLTVEKPRGGVIPIE